MKDLEDAFKAVAKQHGVSEEEVRQEIELAIAAASETKNLEAQEMWNKVRNSDNELTTYNFVQFLMESLTKKH